MASPAPAPAASSVTSQSFLPGDLVTTVGEYLDYNSLCLSIPVCRVWKDALALIDKEDAYCQTIGYPYQLVQALRSRKLSLWRLPELERGSYKECYRASPSDLSSPLMRFRTSEGMMGLAVKLRGHAEGTISFCAKVRGPISIQAITGVYSILQQFRNPCTRWRVMSGQVEEANLASAYRVLHRPDHVSHVPGDEWMSSSCPTCPSYMDAYYSKWQWAVALINQTDIAMKMDGEIAQVAPPPLPKPVLRPLGPASAPSGRAP